MKLITLSPDQILPPTVPMRDGMDDEKLRELAADIRLRGLISPLVVTPEGDHWRLVAGHRRLLACQLAGLVEIPAVEKQLDEEAAVAEMVAENLHREAPNPLEEARVFAIIHEATGKTLAEIGALVNKSPQYVGNRLRVWHGPEDIRQALRDAQISLSVALELERCAHDGDRGFLLGHAIAGGATAATVSRWVKDAAQTRAMQQDAPPGTLQPVIIEQHDTIMSACEWCRRKVPMEQTLAFRVCGDDYVFLQQLREQIEKERRGEPSTPEPV